jgi:FtsH-binding integral membrane protein
MAYSQARSFRSIDSAVATLGVSDRVAFLRRTYAHLGIALLAWAGLSAGILRFSTELSARFSSWALSSGTHWLLIIGAFMVIGYVADRLAESESSRALQYLGLGLTVVAWSFLLQPLLWVVAIKAGAGGTALLMQAGLITGAIFIGLTLTVFLTRKDFSFLRSALTIGSFAAFGVIIASIAFGFSLGALFSGVMILLMAGYILYQTSQVMEQFRPTQHVAAALMLFSTVATLFWYVVRLLLATRD